MTLVRKVKSNWHVFPACKNWLNFSFRGQFEINILIVRHIQNTTYFIWIKKNKLEPAIIWKLVTCQRITSKRYSTSMGRHLSPRYGQVILVSGYPVLTAVNWSQHWCAICVQYQSSCAPKLTRKCQIEHWFPYGADGRASGRCTVTWLPNFLGWVDLLTLGPPQARFACQSSAINFGTPFTVVTSARIKREARAPYNTERRWFKHKKISV